MPVHPLAGKPAPASLLIDPAAVEKAFFDRKPNVDDPLERVAFGTSGHRGSALDGSFNEAHIAAITQAICELRASRGIDGPLYLGKDTHAVSPAAELVALEVLAANGVTVMLAEGSPYTPTPAVSHAILAYNAERTAHRADGILVTPSHNPPADGGFKYNPPNGGPADTDITGWVENRANELLRSGNAGVKRIASKAALEAATTHRFDYITPYVRDLGAMIDMEAIRAAGVRIGVDPLGGAATHYVSRIQEVYGVDLTVVNATIDPTFRFMSVDHDGKIRMDCSSPYAMASLVALRDQYDVSFGNDADADRHGIVTRSGLMNPNHFLAVAIRYLVTHRHGWSKDAAIGKTLVSSGLIDRVAKSLERRVVEVPVGFKWFSSGLADGTLCFGGEESAGASFLRRDGTVWTTDKDGPVMGLLAAEILAKTGKDPSKHLEELTKTFGTPSYTRIDAPATPKEKALLKNLAPEAITATELAGEAIVAKTSKAPGNGAAIGGVKVESASGWFAARPSGTEDVYKLYAESFRGEEHLAAIVEQAKGIVAKALGAG
jgi:phosphoglucomutase